VVAALDRPTTVPSFAAKCWDSPAGIVFPGIRDIDVGCAGLLNVCVVMQQFGYRHYSGVGGTMRTE